MQSSRVQQTDWDKVFRVELGKVEGFLFCLFGSFVFSILAVFPDWLTAGLVERMSFLGPGPSQTNLWPDPKPVVVVVESEGFAGQTGSDCQKESDYFFKWDNWRGGVFLALPFHVVKKKLGVVFFLGFFCFCFLFLFVFFICFFYLSPPPTPSSSERHAAAVTKSNSCITLLSSTVKCFYLLQGCYFS